MTVAASIVLAGGRASRLGGTSKALLRIDGRPALARVVDALIDAHRSVVVAVGPADDIVSALRYDPASDGGGTRTDDRRRRVVRTAIEAERFGGPAVAVAAGVAELLDAGVDRSTLVDVLATDLVAPADLVAALDAASAGRPAGQASPAASDASVAPASAATRPGERTEGGEDGVVLLDEEGREQWLAARIRLDALDTSLAGAAAGEPLHRRLGELRLARATAHGRVTRDIDTPADLAAYGAQVHVGDNPSCL